MGDFALSFLVVKTKKPIYSNMQLVGQKKVKLIHLRRASELSRLKGRHMGLKPDSLFVSGSQSYC